MNVRNLNTDILYMYEYMYEYIRLNAKVTYCIIVTVRYLLFIIEFSFCSKMLVFQFFGSLPDNE